MAKYTAVPTKSGWLRKWVFLEYPDVLQVPALRVVATIAIVVENHDPCIALIEADDGLCYPLGFEEAPDG